jgi:hypothetical protein
VEEYEEDSPLANFADFVSISDTSGVPHAHILVTPVCGGDSNTPFTHTAQQIQRGYGN